MNPHKAERLGFNSVDREVIPGLNEDCDRQFFKKGKYNFRWKYEEVQK